MNSILNGKHSENRLQGVLSPRKSNESVETAGSLAMNVYHSLFSNDCYDEFSTNNPFAVDYSLYSGETVAYNGFLSDFSNAMSVLDGGCSSFSDGGFCSASSGGFSSVC